MISLAGQPTSVFSFDGKIRRKAFMDSTIRIAVLGLYNSGSTAIARMLQSLGVNMGAPFWKCDDDGADNNFYEPADLASHLRKWWDEPRAVECTQAADRISFLRCWIESQEAARPQPAGAKHPLLSLCPDDLVDAWGPNTRFIWCWRPLDQSITKLKQRGWFIGHAEALQKKLWAALTRFHSRHFSMEILDWGKVQSEPEWAARALATLAEVDRSDAQLKAAARCIRPRRHVPADTHGASRA